MTENQTKKIRILFIISWHGGKSMETNVLWTVLKIKIILNCTVGNGHGRWTTLYETYLKRNTWWCMDMCVRGVKVFKKQTQLGAAVAWAPQTTTRGPYVTGHLHVHEKVRKTKVHRPYTRTSDNYFDFNAIMLVGTRLQFVMCLMFLTDSHLID